MRIQLGALTLALTLAAGGASAKDFQPAIIFDMGGKFDKSFNEAAYNGAEKFKKETGLPYLEFEVDAARPSASRRWSAWSAGGRTWSSSSASPSPRRSRQIAKEYPKPKFTIIDTVVDLPNVQSVVFKEHEGSFLVGMAAPWRSKTGKVGFVGGMDIPLIRKFQLGYEQGVKHVDPNAEVLVEHTPAPRPPPGPTRPAAASWRIGQFDQGADVVYAAAGATGLGVLQAAADKGKLAIGVDSDQNYLHPGHVLTSMVKRVDVAVYKAFRDAKDGTWKAGVAGPRPQGGRRRLCARPVQPQASSRPRWRRS